MLRLSHVPSWAPQKWAFQPVYSDMLETKLSLPLLLASYSQLPNTDPPQGRGSSPKY